MKSYLSYQEYSDLGYSLVPESCFLPLSYKATGDIDYYTQHRIGENVPDSVKFTACELVEIYHNQPEQQITSVSTSKYSESYAKEKSIDQKVFDIVYKYLPQSLTSLAVEP